MAKIERKGKRGNRGEGGGRVAEAEAAERRAVKKMSEAFSRAMRTVANYRRAKNEWRAKSLALLELKTDASHFGDPFDGFEEGAE